MRLGHLLGIIMVVVGVIANAEMNENEYVDLNIAELGEEEPAVLKAIEGQWKRPNYTKPDPKYAKEWAKITSYKIPAWLPIFCKPCRPTRPRTTRMTCSRNGNWRF